MNALKDIYFYNAFGLASEIRSGTLTEYRAVKHLIASTIISGIGFDVPLSIEFGEYNIRSLDALGGLVMFVLLGVISYYGVWLIYQVNRKGDGKDFFMRFSALSLPVGIQLAVLFLGIGIVLMAFAFILSEQFGEVGAVISQLIFYAATVVFSVMFFLRMRKYIAVAANSDAE